MEYTALYRRFRPKTFSEILGQDHITQTLKNQVIANRVGHAYLFTGCRGCGKTSAAKVLSRAVNCLNPKDGEPCNECSICKSALDGSLTDIVEMDAASNNSVDDIRAIRDEVNFLPTLAKYRVYIIDEVHMLSTGAFNALLKTLEEPPAHVKFILATTEPQKLPATILSRCQRFDFKKISNDNISKRLQYVCDESKIEITKEALKIISILSEGAMRDALSILERCIQEGSEKVDEDLVKDLVGIPKLTFVSKIVKAIVEYHMEEALQVVNEVLKEGKDLSNLLWEIIKYVKDVLVLKTGGKLEIYSEEEIKVITEISQLASKERLLNLIHTLSKLENDMKWSSQRNIMFEVAIIGLSSPQTSAEVGAQAGIEELTARIKNLEEKLAKGNFTVKNESFENTEKAPAPKRTSNIAPKLEVGEVENLNIPKLDFWPKIVNQLKEERKMLLATNLMNTVATMINDMTVGIVFVNGLTPFVKTIIERQENINELTRLISIECKQEMRVKILDNKEAVLHQKNKVKSPEEEAIKELDIPINIIDE